MKRYIGITTIEIIDNTAYLFRGYYLVTSLPVERIRIRADGWFRVENTYSNCQLVGSFIVDEV